MKKRRLNFLFWIFLFSIVLKSCSKDDGVDLPGTGENSFRAKIEDRIFIPEDVHKFIGTTHGILCNVQENSWHMTFRNSSKKNIHIYLKDVNGPGKYRIGKLDDDFIFFTPTDTESAIGISNGEDNYYGVAFASSNLHEQYLEVTKVEGDSIIIGSFKEIILKNQNNPEKIVKLTKGQFHINTNNLNPPNYIE
ncbi:hypothetical protein [Salinimicrobium sp. GXAS 041]|uniref:hypothetical protein n=1 Tax=Salinimicrobium sp. GXAS 041 TaxID=3400806 RepID=UPI003C76CE22